MEGRRVGSGEVGWREGGKEGRREEGKEGGRKREEGERQSYECGC